VVVDGRPEMSVSAAVDDPSSPVISLAGELDLASVGVAREGIEECLAARPSQVTFDLQELTFMDSSGIALLVQISNEVEKVSLVNVTPIVWRVLEATGLLGHFGLTP
jgi:anti-sigma B factor antagonist